MERYGKYRIAGSNNQLMCQCCNKKGFSLKQISDHIIQIIMRMLSGRATGSTVWESDWKYRVHLVASFPRRQALRADMSVRKKEASGQKKKRDQLRRGQ